MVVKERDGEKYRLPGSLNHFQEDLYIHLINWKWRHITKEAGCHNYKGDNILYDAILPNNLATEYPTLYPEIRDRFREHQARYKFRKHVFFNHMASSQAANANLFLPLLGHPKAAEVLRKIKPDFHALATDQLDSGFRIEYWDEETQSLKDHNKATGTDSDIAIAYYDNNEKLCLWLIEHKLSEAEFTSCGGTRSKGRTEQHNCNLSVEELVNDKGKCYYHSGCNYEYWNITEKHQKFFGNHANHTTCPFKGGMNQLWRNQLMGLSIEDHPEQPYKHVYFSVVHHQGNRTLNSYIDKYKSLINNNPKFSVFTSDEIINAASEFKEPSLDKWMSWYKQLYMI